MKRQKMMSSINGNDIAVLCASNKSKYYLINGLDIYDNNRNAFTFNSNLPIIAHPPCAQWSRLKGLAKPLILEKYLAVWCYEWIVKNGGILEHPNGSYLFDYLGIRNKCYKVDLREFGYPAIKTTLLYFHNYKPISQPLTLEPARSNVTKMHSADRMITPIKFNRWLVDAIRQGR
jgi:hypothetical protein